MAASLIHRIINLLAALTSASAVVQFIPTSQIGFLPVDRWATRGGGPNGTLIFESKWGSATAVASSAVNATAAPFPTSVGLVYGTGSSNGYARVAVNGQVITTLNTYAPATNYSNELVIPLKGLPNHPLWVLTVEATGTWQSGSKDSYIEVVGVNVYFSS
jgi:hypothetical protein